MMQCMDDTQPKTNTKNVENENAIDTPPFAFVLLLRFYPTIDCRRREERRGEEKSCLGVSHVRSRQTVRIGPYLFLFL